MWDAGITGLFLVGQWFLLVIFVLLFLSSGDYVSLSLSLTLPLSISVCLFLFEYFITKTIMLEHLPCAIQQDHWQIEPIVGKRKTKERKLVLKVV